MLPRMTGSERPDLHPQAASLLCPIALAADIETSNVGAKREPRRASTGRRAHYSGAMAARTVTCAACGGTTSLPDRAWDEQRASIEDWWDEHLWSAHANQDRTALVHQIEPNPFFEPPPFIHGWG